MTASLAWSQPEAQCRQGLGCEALLESGRQLRATHMFVIGECLVEHVGDHVGHSNEVTHYLQLQYALSTIDGGRGLTTSGC